MEAGSWHRVDPVDVPAEGRVRSVTVDGRTVALARCGAGLGTLENRCPHQGGPLGEGSIENGWLRCPWHGYDYDPLTGRPPEGFSDGPAAYEVAERADGVYVHLPAPAPKVRTVADVLVETLVAFGITHVFGMVGHSNLGFADAMRRAEERGQLTFTGIRHEGAASFAASAYGKLTGRPAACFAIAGPGSTNMLTGFNKMIDRRPALIARCTSTADVAAAVSAAREHGLVVAVRGGGHSFSGLSTCDDGIVIDLRGLKSITMDPQSRTARAGGGVLWGEFDAATQAHGLHTPGGRVTTTGLGGFTTGGGYGWTSSKYGLACDNLISAEVVLADGSVVRASEHEHADLFWGIRGGGGNFGVVTEFEFRLHPLGPIVLAGLAMFPIDRAPEVLRGWRDWADAAPDEVSTGCAVITAPPEEFVPPELRGQPVLGIPVLYVGDPKAGAAAVQPLKDLGPAVDHIGPMPYTAFQAALDPLAPWDLGGFYARGEYMPGLSDAAIEVFLARAPDVVTLSPPFSQMIIFRIGQGVAAVPGDATAFSHRDASYLFHPITAWLDPADGEKMIAATRTFAAAMRPFSTGASYLNFTHEADRVRDAYGDATYARLVALKDTYDPANLFRLNQNIRPSQPAAEPALA